ncbi:glycosyl hydrolase family 61-domain-containing protein [Xylariaceae sp. FL1019]|nr:glycosyl hydrolase family 61-domain-containing protein [Xylariaceae sp. FL1019]
MLSKISSTIVIIATTLHSARAHWVYNRLIVDGTYVGEPYQYIRPSSNGNNFISNVNSTDMRCNVGVSSGLTNRTETATVRAGDEVGFGIDETFGHPGIQQVYLSRAPDLPDQNTSLLSSAAAAYDGSGDWVRIYSLTTTPTLPNGTGTAGKNSFAEAQPGAVDWATHKLTNFTFPLSEDTPEGEYLLRAEGMAVHAAHKQGGAQFYVSCAQIKVVNEARSTRMGMGRDTFGPSVRIPGAYSGNEPGILIPQFWSALMRYTTPGPALWPQGTAEQHVARHL